jgi:hypothetical protein
MSGVPSWPESAPIANTRWSSDLGPGLAFRATVFFVFGNLGQHRMSVGGVSETLQFSK